MNKIRRKRLTEAIDLISQAIKIVLLQCRW